jgi:hypothetical protein
MKLLRKLFGFALIGAAFYAFFLSWNASRFSDFAELALIDSEINALSVPDANHPDDVAQTESQRELAKRDKAFFEMLRYSTLAAGIALGLCGAFVCYYAWKAP